MPKMPETSMTTQAAQITDELVKRLTDVRERLLIRGDYDAHGSDVCDATTIGEAIAILTVPIVRGELRPDLGKDGDRCYDKYR